MEHGLHNAKHSAHLGARAQGMLAVALRVVNNNISEWYLLFSCYFKIEPSIAASSWEARLPGCESWFLSFGHVVSHLGASICPSSK